MHIGGRHQLLVKFRVHTRRKKEIISISTCTPCRTQIVHLWLQNFQRLQTRCHAIINNLVTATTIGSINTLLPTFLRHFLLVFRQGALTTLLKCTRLSSTVDHLAHFNLMRVCVRHTAVNGTFYSHSRLLLAYHGHVLIDHLFPRQHASALLLIIMIHRCFIKIQCRGTFRNNFCNSKRWKRPKNRLTLWFI